jgi:hypothetical protein
MNIKNNIVTYQSPFDDNTFHDFLPSGAASPLIIKGRSIDGITNHIGDDKPIRSHE